MQSEIVFWTRCEITNHTFPNCFNLPQLSRIAKRHVDDVLAQKFHISLQAEPFFPRSIRKVCRKGLCSRRDKCRLHACSLWPLGRLTHEMKMDTWPIPVPFAFPLFDRWPNVAAGIPSISRTFDTGNSHWILNFACGVCVQLRPSKLQAKGKWHFQPNIDQIVGYDSD